MSMKQVMMAVAGIGALVGAPTQAEAQFLKKLLPKAERAAERAADKAVDRVLRETLGDDDYAVGGADVPRLMEGRWGLSEAHCMQTEPYAPGTVTIDAESIWFEARQEMFGAPSVKGETFMRASVNHLSEAGPVSRDLSFQVRGRRILQWTEHDDYGEQVSDKYVRCRPLPAPQPEPEEDGELL